MHRPSRFVVFALDDGLYALHLAAVERVVRAVQVTPLPKVPEIVLGFIDVQGRVIPVLDIRKRFRLPEREVQLNDHLIIARTSTRAVALLVDSVVGTLQREVSEVIEGTSILPGLEYVEGVVKLEGGLILIHDLDKFLSLEEEKALHEAMG